MIHFLLKQLFRILIVACAMWGTLALPQDLRNREQDLSESLLDLNAIVAAGVNRSDFKRALPELTVKFDRYVRAGGKKYGDLYDVLKAFRDADEAWDQRVQASLKAMDYDAESRYKIDQMGKEQVQRHLGYAQKALDSYQQARRRESEAKPASRKKTPDDEAAARYQREIEAIQEKSKADSARLEAEFKEQMRDLDSRRACKYTRPPSC